jgi:hypothetical protein
MCVFDPYEFSEEIWNVIQYICMLEVESIIFLFCKVMEEELKESGRTNMGSLHDFQDVHIGAPKEKIK